MGQKERYYLSSSFNQIRLPLYPSEFTTDEIVDYLRQPRLIIDIPNPYD